MAHVRIENFREDRGGWHMRAEGDADVTAEQVAARVQDYALQYPARAFVDGVLVGEAQPQAKRRARKGR